MITISRLAAVATFAVLVSASSLAAVGQPTQESVDERQKFFSVVADQTAVDVDKTFEFLERNAECTAALIFVQTYADADGDFTLSKDASNRVKRLMRRFDSIADGITLQRYSEKSPREEWISREMRVYENMSKEQRYRYIQEVLEVNSCLAFSEER